LPHDLSARQAALVVALVDGGPLPAGFAAGSLDLARRVIAHKRGVAFRNTRRRRAWILFRILGWLVRRL